MPTIDFSQVSDGFAPLPDGDYPAQLSEFKFKTSQAGNACVDLTFNLKGEFENRKAWRTYALTPNSLWALKAALVALGVDNNDLGGEIELEEILPGLIGNDCVLTLKVKEYNGKKSNEVKKVSA